MRFLQFNVHILSAYWNTCWIIGKHVISITYKLFRCTAILASIINGIYICEMIQRCPRSASWMYIKVWITVVVLLHITICVHDYSRRFGHVKSKAPSHGCCWKNCGWKQHGRCAQRAETLCKAIHAFLLEPLPAALDSTSSPWNRFNYIWKATGKIPYFPFHFDNFSIRAQEVFVNRFIKYFLFFKNFMRNRLYSKNKISDSYLPHPALVGKAFLCYDERAKKL